MSIIGGQKKEEKQFESFSKYIGFFKAEVVAVNPDRSKLNELLGKEDSPEDKEIDYTGEKDGVPFSRISFWLSVEGHPNLHFSHSIVLKNEVRRNKTKEKIQLINSVGDTQWVEADEDGNYDESLLYDNFKNFTNVTSWQLPTGEIVEKYQKGAKPAEDGVQILAAKEFRPALVGEEELAEFMKGWLSQLNLKAPGANILLETKKLFGGNFKDLQLIDGEYDRPFVALAYVRVDENDNTKLYQKVFKKFLPPTFIKFINNGCKMPNRFNQELWDKFVTEVEGDYGPDGFYVLEPLKEYNPNEDVAASGKTKVNEEVADDSSPMF